MQLNSKLPSGPIETAWDRRKFEMKLVNPANKRKYSIIVVGSGLAGGAASATLAELGYNVKCFCFQDSPRRAHSIAAQGGINAAKNYQNDGDSVFRLFYDTVKGGDFRSREANVYRLAQISAAIIDQCAAQGVPFAREYGGLLANRSFGGVQVSRTFYARGQTGQQLLLGADQVPESERDYYLERLYPSFGNLAPRDIASRRAKEVCDEGRGVGPGGHGVYLDFQDAIRRLGRPVIAERYGNLFEMYQRITAENPYLVPMRIYPAPHYTMGGLWVDYNLMTTVEGLYAIGEANFSDHGANRLGASALMQGLADGYFILPYTIGDYLAQAKLPKVDAGHVAARQTEAEVGGRTRRLLEVNGHRSVDTFHRALGRLMWDRCGMSRSAAGLKDAMQRVCVLREEFWQDVYVGGRGEDLNQLLEHAGRVADFFEFAELMCHDALEREESCGCHFREEYQTPEGEAKRDDARFSHVAAWEFAGVGKAPVLHREPLEFEAVHLAQRSYQ